MYNSLSKNISELKSITYNSADFTVRNIELTDKEKTKAAVITIEGMCDKEGIAIAIINPLINADYEKHKKENLYEFIKSSVLSASELVEIDTFNQVMTFSMSGFAVVAVDGSSKMLAIGIQGFSFRSVSSPETEVIQRGPREGFVEPLRINMTMIRRRIKNPDLVFETLEAGDVSKTQMCICYLKSAVSDDILNELRKRLKQISLSTVMGAGYLVPFLEENNRRSLFSAIGVTERPDTVCGKITEGRIAIIIDGTPSVLTVPHLFVEKFQSVDDYSNRPFYASFTRILKYISFLVAVYLPGLYTAFAAFHPDYFPAMLLQNIITSVSKTPLPVGLEVFLILFIYEVMREAGLRIPRPLGHAVSIVGALVIGEAAVSAGIIGSPTLMVVAIAAICSYVIPELYPAITVARLLLIVAGAIFGLWGIVLLSCVYLVIMCSKTSFGVPYMTPITPFSKKNMRDVFIRSDWKNLSKFTQKVQNLKGTKGAEDEIQE
ncbi:MAG: spore germination protein [Ruminococcus sp.]